MRKIKIGIIGYGGKVGSSLVKIFPLSSKLKLGQRNLTPINRPKNTEYERVDATDFVSLQSFVQDLDILVNCAGPSYLIKEKLVKSALQKGIGYIDAFGGKELEACLSKEKGQFVIGAGAFPGFSGLLPLYVANKFFDKVESFSLLSNHNEESSYSAAYDLIFSSLQQFGKSGYCYQNGKLVKTNPPEKEWSGFEKNSEYLDYINEETCKIADFLNVEEAHWLNVYHDVQHVKRLKKMTLDYVQTKDERKLAETIQQVVDQSRVENSWYKIACEMIGKKKNSRKKAYVFFEFPESYAVGSELMKEIILKMSQEKGTSQEREGVMWAYSYINPEPFIKKIIQKGMIRVLSETYEEWPEIEEGEV